MAASTTPEIRIDRALEDHPILRGTNVQVHGDRRLIVLEGDVTTYYHKQMVQEIVRRIDGVEEIENRLMVDWSRQADSPETTEDFAAS